MTLHGDLPLYVPPEHVMRTEAWDLAEAMAAPIVEGLCECEALCVCDAAPE